MLALKGLFGALAALVDTILVYLAGTVLELSLAFAHSGNGSSLHS
jgi:hypothetical protein